MKEYVVLVNEFDEPIGMEEKQRAHELGLLHRAFSIFIYRKTQENIEILLQKRSVEKYHCGGLWTNTCCSHPRANESILNAAKRRLNEEMSLAVPLTIVGSFTYQATFDNGLIEHEFDHVLIGEYNGKEEILAYNPAEIEDCRWIRSTALQEALLLDSARQEKQYTPWLAPAFELVRQRLCI